MNITQIDATHLMSTSGMVDIRDIRDIKRKKFSLGRTAALGAGGAAAAAATLLLYGAIGAAVSAFLGKAFFSAIGL